MRSPLTVRINDGVRDQQITRYVKGLQFTKTAPGGHHSATVNIDAPDGTLADLGPADRLYIYDGRNASTVWDGYTDNPGRQSVAGGETFSLSAMGGVVLTNDNVRPVVFVDRDLNHKYWRPVASRGGQVDVEQGATPTDPPTIKSQWPNGSVLPATAGITMTNTLLAFSGQMISNASAIVTAGKADADYRTYIFALSQSGISTFAYVPFSTTPFFSKVQAGTNWTPSMTIPNRFDRFALVLDRNAAGGVTVADDTTLARWFDVIVVPSLRDPDGTYTYPTTTYTLSHQAVKHLIGDGMLPVDLGNLVVESGTAQIQQLAYMEGVKPSQVLDDLELYEPDFLWEILETGPTGLHRFAYRKWPTTPRYEISGRTFSESGGEADLCNRILVTWTNEGGVVQTTIRTAVVEELGTRTKDAEPITLPEGMGSLANAQRIGDEILAALNTPSRAGTATVSAPIYDHLRRLTVMPWEIEPGYLVRVRDRGIDLRLSEMTYDDSDVTTTLTLGSPVLSLEQRIARLAR